MKSLAARYEFSPIEGYVLTVDTVSRLKRSSGTALVSLDLGRTRCAVEVEGGRVRLPSGAELDLSLLEEVVSEESRAYFVYPDGRGPFEVSFFSAGRYYRLRVVAPDTAPTLEISGIHMHRIKDVTPIEDTLEKLKLARVGRRCVVLDVCTGLGYTAIYSLAMGATRVLSIEKDPNVLEIARYNPWSRELADPRVEVVLADAAEYVGELSDESFDRIVHDPPTLALAGELYGLEFYKELYRVLKKGGCLFHYTGAPGSKRGVRVQAGVARRLREAGFRVVRVIKDLGVVASK